jgi:hypothetical protein
MFKNMFTENKNFTDLEETIDKVLTKLKTTDPETEEFAKLNKQLHELYECKAIETPSRIKPEVVLTIGANLVGILAVLEYEHFRIVTSKAVTFIPKLFR